jgi:hypothetical protein
MNSRISREKSTDNKAPKWRAVLETGFIIGGLLANLVLIPHTLSSDAVMRVKELSQLLSAHTFSTSRFSLVGPFFAAPLWFLGKINQTSEWWCLRYNTVLLALAMLAFYLLLRNRLDRSLLRIFLILLIFASMLTQQLTDFDGEIFTALLVMVGAVFVVQWRGKIGWPMIIIGAVNAPASLVGLGLLTLTRILSTRHLRYIVVPVLAIALIGLEDWIRRGSPLNTGYYDYDGNIGFRTVMPYSGLPGFSYPIFFGLLSILFSFGKGLVYYMPGLFLFLPVRKRLLSMGKVGREMYATYQLWMAFVIGLVLVYSRWWAWYGGWYWGPRFFLLGSMIACFSVALIVRHPSNSLVVNLLYLVILMLSFWVGIDGAVFGQNTLAPVCLYNNFALEALCYYTPEFTALWRPFVVYEPLSAGQIAYIAFSVIVCAYLAFPLLQTVALQVRTQLSRLRWMYKVKQAWYF